MWIQIKILGFQETPGKIRFGILYLERGKFPPFIHLSWLAKWRHFLPLSKDRQGSCLPSLNCSLRIGLNASRPSEKQLSKMRRIELCNPLGSLDVFYFNLYHFQEAWQHRDDIKLLSFKGPIQLHNYSPNEFDPLLESIRERLETFFTFRNVEQVQMSLTLKERDLPSLWSEWEMAKCWEDWATYLQSMRKIMEGPREYAQPIILPWPVSLELCR